MDNVDLIDLKEPSESLITLGGDFFSDDAFKQSLLQAIEENPIVVLVTDSADTSQLASVVCSSRAISKDSKIAFIESSDSKAKQGACTLSSKMTLGNGLEVGCTTLLVKPNEDNIRYHFFSTEMMIKEISSHPNLGNYSMICVNYSHDQLVNTDILLFLIKAIRRCRPNLKLLVTTPRRVSKKIIDFFDDPHIIRSTRTGSEEEVRIVYARSAVVNIVQAAILATTKIHLSQPVEGDILVYLTCDDDILTAKRLLETKTVEFEKQLCVSVYAESTGERRVSTGSRRAILTKENLVSCSLFPQIKYIVDAGYCTMKTIDSQHKVEIENMSRITKCLAFDRANLGGGGLCVRLYNCEVHSQMPELIVPEIERSDLSSMILLLASLGIHPHDVGAQLFVNQPPSPLLDQGMQLLEALGAIDGEAELTPVGKMMTKLFPLNPMTVKCMLASEVHGCSSEIATIFAMIESNILIKNKGETAGDHISLMKLYDAWESHSNPRSWCWQNSVPMNLMVRAQKMKHHLESALQQVGISIRSNDDTEAIAKTITSGYFYNAAKLEKDGMYVTIQHKQIVEIAEESVLYKQARPPRFLVYHKHVKGKEVAIVTEVRERWLCEAHPGYCISEKLPSKGNLHLQSWIESSSYDKAKH